VRESWCAKGKNLVNGSEDNDGAGVGKSDCTLLYVEKSAFTE